MIVFLRLGPEDKLSYKVMFGQHGFFYEFPDYIMIYDIMNNIETS